MQKITMNIPALTGILTGNRDKHRTVFEAALGGYKKQLLADLEANVAALKAGRVPDVTVRYSRPQDHTRDYDRVLRMLRLHEGDTFELTEQDFAQYVEDDWAWKRQWVKMSNTYAAATTQAMYGDDEEED